MNIKVKEIVEYGGHSLAANGSVNLTLKAGYPELTNTMQVLQMLNNDISVKAKVPNCSPVKLGYFRVKQIVFDGDGESKIKFNGLKDYVEMDNLNTLPLKNDDGEMFAVMMEAEIEEEDGGDQ